MKTLEKICHLKIEHKIDEWEIDGFKRFTFTKDKLFTHFDRCYAVGRESIAVDFEDLKK